MERPQIDTVPEPNAPGKGRSDWLRFTLDILETLVLAVLLFAGINAISARIRVDGSSMEPSLHSGEFVLVNKLAYKLGNPKLGDVIVFRYPRDPQQEYIKRVIGLPGNHIRIANGQVYVDDRPINEPYIAARPVYPDQNWVVPDNSLFVLGDNRNNSSDSHNWGPVPMNNVIGRAMLVYWPPDLWGLVGGPSTANAAH